MFKSSEIEPIVTFEELELIEENDNGSKKEQIVIRDEAVSASSRIEQLTPINFEHFRSQTCSGDVSYGS